MRTILGELFLLLAYQIAGSESPRSRNLRWSVFHYFDRFRDAPNPPPVKLAICFMKYLPFDLRSTP